LLPGHEVRLREAFTRIAVEAVRTLWTIDRERESFFTTGRAREIHRQDRE